MKKIIWLASYPKSGNTWVRIFLSCLIKETLGDGFINDLIIPIISARSFYDDYLDIESSDLTFYELEMLKADAMRCFAGEIDTTPFFMKAHDAYTYRPDKAPVFAADISLGAIYIVRNPLDIAASFASHLDVSIDKVIELMANKDAMLAPNARGITPQVRQRLGSWTSHVSSWTGQEDMPVLTIRYEDLVLDPFNTFKKIVEFSSLPYSNEQILAAMEKSSFNNLQQQEQKFGFHEKVSSKNPFFRKGKIGGGKEELTPVQIEKITNGHRAVMEAYGYIAT